jgi:hypothetical protein
MPAVAIHAAVLLTGGVVFYQSGSTLRVLNWVDWTFCPIPVTENIFCSCHAFLADGTLLVTGGAITTGRGRPVVHPAEHRCGAQPHPAQCVW